MEIHSMDIMMNVYIWKIAKYLEFMGSTFMRMTQISKNTKESSRTINPMAREKWYSQIRTSTQDIGQRVNSMAMESMRGRMEIVITEILSMEERKEEEHTFGVADRMLVRDIKDNLKITNGMELEFTHLRMAKNTKGNGVMINLLDIVDHQEKKKKTHKDNQQMKELCADCR